MARFRDKLVPSARAFHADDRGGTALIYALTLPIVVGFIGLGVEVGDWYMTRQALQNSADAGAWAASIAYYHDPYIASDELAATAQAGVERSGTEDADVTVVSGQPLPGGLTNLGVRVTLAQTKPTLFASAFGIAETEIDATSLAAAALDTVNVCLAGLNHSAPHSVSTKGSAWSVPAGCNIHSNSGVYMNGNPNLSGIEVTYTGESCDAPSEVCARPAIQPYNDPYAELSLEDSNPGCTFNDLAGPGGSIDGETIDLGGYADRTVVLCGDSNFNHDTTFVGPGRVIVNGTGGGSFDADGTLIGDEVSLIFSDIDLGHIGGNGGLRLTPITEDAIAGLSPGVQELLDPWVGIALYADRDTVGGSWEITGSFDMNVDGVIYMPEVDLVVKGTVDPYNASGCLRIFTATADIRGNIDFGQASCDPYSMKGVGRVRPRIYG